MKREIGKYLKPCDYDDEIMIARFPCDSCRNRRSKKARARDKAKEHRYVRRRVRNETQDLLNENNIPCKGFSDFTQPDFRNAGTRKELDELSGVLHLAITRFIDIIDDKPKEKTELGVALNKIEYRESMWNKIKRFFKF